MIVSIGVDCGVSDCCKKYGLRNMSLPFDWVVSYNGVSECIADDFKSYTSPFNNRINKYDIYFHHDFNGDSNSDDDIAKYDRRCNRLINLLETSSDEIIFCRKGHACRHHYEHDSKYFIIKNDIDEVENLSAVLSKKYPNLNYKIILTLQCGHCFDSTRKYTSKSDKIEIHNISGSLDDHGAFDEFFRGIMKL